jgi:hypothetical protein
VSEPSNSDGAVYVFQYQSLSWTLTQTLKEGTFQISGNLLQVQNYGFSLALSPDYSVLVIGAPYKGM